MIYKSKFTGPEVDDAIERVLNEETFNTSSRYPDMSVGFADDLVGRGESVPAEFSFRASGGKSIKDGTARIKRLKGNSVVWNQQVKHESRTEGSCSSAWDGDVITIDGLSSQSYYSIMQSRIPCVLNEKFLIIAEEVANPNNLSFSVGILNAVQDRATLGGGNTFSAVIGNSITTVESGFGIDKFGGAGTDLTGIRFKVRVINLTKMFQAGNEPTTFEEYEARKPIVADEYAYNEGQVIHCNTESIKSVGDNAWDEEWEQGGISEINGKEYDVTHLFRTKNYIRVLPNTQYYFKKPIGIVTYLMFYDDNKNFVKWLDPFATVGEGGVFTTPNAPYMRFVCYESTYKNDITISLYHSGWKQDTDAKYQPYWEDRLMFDKRIKDEFPNGMKKWDMVYNKNGKGYVVKGTYEVKIKDLNIRRDAEGIFIAQPIPAVANTDSNGYSKEIVTARFIGDGTAYSYNLSPYNSAFIVENSLWMNGQSLASYLTVEDFIRDYGDDMLYYQLAEPVIIEYDEPFNLDYKVADFGTEEIIAPQPSAPISADIIYQFNAVDMIREHELEITELQRIIATMQAQLTSLTSNNNN